MANDNKIYSELQSLLSLPPMALHNQKKSRSRAIELIKKSIFDFNNGVLSKEGILAIFKLKGLQFSNLLYILNEYSDSTTRLSLAACLIDESDHQEADRLSKWLTESLQALRFISSSEQRGESGVTRLEWRFYPPTGDHGSSTTLGIRRIINRETDPSYLWDEFQLKNNGAISTLITLAEKNNISLFARTIVKKQSTLNSLWKYHPERMKSYRIYVKTPPAEAIEGTEFGNLYAQQAADLRATILVESSVGLMEVPVRSNYNEWVGLKHLIARKETEVFVMRGAFCSGGKRIFSIDQKLVEMFLHTDVAEVGFDTLKSPFKSFYLHFGKVESLQLNKGWYVDGAYVCHSEELQAFQVMLTSIPDDELQLANWDISPEPSFSISVRGEEYKNNMEGVLNACIARKRNTSEENMRRIRDEEIVITHDGPRLQVDITRFAAQAEAKHDQGHYGIAEAALRLVVNSICCITSYGENIESGWPEFIPENFKTILDSGNVKDIKRAESTLEKLGYRKIPTLKLSSLIPQGKSIFHSDFNVSFKSSHWRKGHWRNQAFGPGWSEHRMKWIMPTLIHQETSEPVKGGIYNIDTFTKDE